MTGSERAAWIAWSALAEPMDALAGALLTAVGPVDALGWLKEVDRQPTRGEAALLEIIGPELDNRLLSRIVAASARWCQRLPRAEPAEHARRATALGARVLTPADHGWPSAVGALGAAAPHALYVLGSGDPAALLDRGVAIVGSRSSTSYGDHVAAELASGLAERGRAVVSGGAYGIDAAAHHGALAAGGATMAVMAGGVDRWYPVGTSALRDDVMRHGCVVSEVPPGWAPHRSRFLSRNRLIACAAGTVVVEAAHRSGALSTARHALALARPVGAVPGAVTSAASAGAHALVRGAEAVLITSAADIEELVGPLHPDEEEVEGSGGPEFGSAQERAAYDGIAARGSSLEQISCEAALSVREARRALAALSSAGLVVLDGGTYRRRS